MKHSDYHGKLLRLAMVFVALFCVEQWHMHKQTG